MHGRMVRLFGDVPRFKKVREKPWSYALYYESCTHCTTRGVVLWTYVVYYGRTQISADDLRRHLEFKLLITIAHIVAHIVAQTLWHLVRESNAHLRGNWLFFGPLILTMLLESLVTKK